MKKKTVKVRGILTGDSVNKNNTLYPVEVLKGMAKRQKQFLVHNEKGKTIGKGRFKKDSLEFNANISYGIEGTVEPNGKFKLTGVSISSKKL